MNYNVMYSARHLYLLGRWQKQLMALQFVDWPYKVMFYIWGFPGCWGQSFSKAGYLELLHPSWGRLVGAGERKNDRIKDKLGCIQAPLQMHSSHNGAVMTLSIN